MKPTCVFTTNALEDIIHHSIYYETISKNLAERFLEEIAIASEEICLLPKGYENRYKNTRERKLKKFLIN